MARYIPQWLARIVCAAFGHPQRRYQAAGIVVRTCRCGDRQDVKSMLNRQTRRALMKKRIRF